MRTAPSQPAAWKLRIALLAIVFAVYANAFGLGTALDGDVIVHADPRIRAATWTNIQTILTTDYWGGLDRLYRPLTTLSFLLNYAVLGNETNAAGYHAVNILLHGLNVLLVFGLARKWFGRDWPAFFAAALWAVHPIGVDTVTNVAGRADLLATAGLLGALSLYGGWPEERLPWWRVAAFFALAFCAVAAKETGAMLFPLLAVSDAVEGRLRPARLKSRAAAYAAAAVALAVYMALRSHVFAGLPWPVRPFTDNPLAAGGFWQARWTAVRMLGADLLLLIWPARLASDRSFDAIPLAGAADPWAWASLLAVLALATAAILRRRKDPAAAWGAAVFALTLLPSSNLVVLIGATMAERFLYLPAIGFCFALAALVYRVAPPRAPAAAVLGAIAVLFAGRTMARNPDWDSNVTLMQHDEKVVPRNYRVHHVYGEALAAAGQADHAIAEFEEAWDILRPLPPERNVQQVPASLAREYLVQGRPEKALPLLLEARAIHRASEAAFDRAQVEHRKALARRVPGIDIYMLLGEAHRQLHRYDEALAAYREARGLVPAEPGAYDRAAAVATEKGDPATAARIELEKMLSFGTTVQGIAALAPWYNNVPDGACAVIVQSGIAALNAACPRLRSDLCLVYPELRRTYLDARAPNRAAEFERMAAQSGCPPQ